MRAVVQRVSRAQVTVGAEIVGEIGRGLLVLLGVAHTDSETDADYLAEKITGLRIFEDENGKMNLDAASIGGQILVVSQFTLLRRCPPRQAPVVRCSSPAPTCPPIVRTFCRTHPGRRHFVRNRPLPGNDAGGVSK